MKCMFMSVAPVSLVRLAVWMALVVYLCFVVLTVNASSSVELSWDANRESDLAGYRVYAGPGSGLHTLLADVGNVTSTIITNLSAGATMYFVVTAYNHSQLESPPSLEVAYTAPVNETNDTTPPVLSCPPDLMVAAASASGAVVAYSPPTATDAADPSPTVTSTPISGSVFPIGTTIVTCAATDASGNIATGAFRVTVKDMTPPVLSCPPDLVIAATSVSGAVVAYPPPTATDTVDPSPAVTSTPASGSAFPIGTTTVTCTATDASGNMASAAFTVTVEAWKAPTLAEALNAPEWNWTTGGKAVWTAQTSVTHDGLAAVQSGAIPNKQTSWIETRLTGPGTLRFWWKVSSEENQDFLRLYINNAEQKRISGEVDWVEVSLNIPSGSQTLRWAYTKGPKAARGTDAGWVDLVSFSATPMAVSASSAPISSETLVSAPSDAAPAPHVAQVSHVEEGAARIIVWGLPGDDCRLLASDNLIHWTTVGFGKIGENGCLEFMDPLASSAAPRFYQAPRPTILR